MNKQETELEINWDLEDTEIVDTVEAVVTDPKPDEVVEPINVKEQKAPVKAKIDKDTTEVKDEEINWDDEDEDIIEDDPKDKKEVVTEVANVKIAVVNTLKDKGYLDFELEDGVELEDLDDDELQDLIDEGLEATQDASIEKVVKNLPPIGKNFLKIMAKGGDGLEYLASVFENNSETIEENLDLEDVENQKRVMSFKLRKEGYDEDYIETFVETLENSNKLKSTATSEFKKVIKEQKEADANEQQKIDNIARERREKERVDVKDMRDFIASKTDIQGIKLSKKEQSELPEYMYKNTVEVDGGRKITKLYYDLFTGIKDKDNLTLIAKIVYNNFKLDSIKKDLATSATGAVRREIQRQETGKESRVKVRGSEAKALHELL